MAEYLAQYPHFPQYRYSHTGNKAILPYDTFDSDDTYDHGSSDWHDLMISRITDIIHTSYEQKREIRIIEYHKTFCNNAKRLLIAMKYIMCARFGILCFSFR